MESYINQIIIVALLAAFVLILAKKWGLVERIQIHGNEFFSKMAHCDFCISWWVNVLITIFVFAVTLDYEVIVIPFLSTIITRKLL